jgi:hypothetical protein
MLFGSSAHCVRQGSIHIYDGSFLDDIGIALVALAKHLGFTTALHFPEDIKIDNERYSIGHFDYVTSEAGRKLHCNGKVEERQHNQGSSWLKRATERIRHHELNRKLRNIQVLVVSNGHVPIDVWSYAIDIVLPINKEYSLSHAQFALMRILQYRDPNATSDVAQKLAEAGAGADRILVAQISPFLPFDMGKWSYQTYDWLAPEPQEQSSCRPN